MVELGVAALEVRFEAGVEVVGVSMGGGVVGFCSSAIVSTVLQLTAALHQSDPKSDI